VRNAWASDTARRLGLAGALEFTPTRIGQTLHVPCERGRHVVDITIRPGLAPNGVAKAMLNKGWTIGRTLTCPDCRPARDRAKHEKEPRPVAPVKTANRPDLSEPPISGLAQRAAVPSDAAKKAHRLAMMALEDYYDETGKRYKPGYSDARIAQETGASEAHVRKTREDYFGPVGAPPELSSITEELRAIRQEAAAYMG
jgi:hypothetical protein